MKLEKIKKKDWEKIKSIFFRYTLVLILVFIITHFLFSKSLEYVLSWAAFLYTRIFFDTQFANQIILYNNHELIIVSACLGLSNYILFTILFFSIQEDIKKLFKTFLICCGIFTLLNYIRIIFLMTTLILYGHSTFSPVHLFFEYFLNAIITAGTFIFVYKYMKIVKKPFVDDLKYLVSVQIESYRKKKKR